MAALQDELFSHPQAGQTSTASLGGWFWDVLKGGFPYDDIWQYFIIYDNIRKYSYVHIWPYMIILAYDNIWQCMVIYGNMIIYDSV